MRDGTRMQGRKQNPDRPGHETLARVFPHRVFRLLSNFPAHWFSERESTRRLG